MTSEAKTPKADKGSKEQKAFEDVVVRRCIYIPGFEIYGGVAGLYDYGPVGTAVMENIKTAWRNHFVHHEEMLEIACTSVTPEAVLKTSGHVDRFTDFMIEDELGQYHRADKILEDTVDAYLANNANLKDEEKNEANRVRVQAGAMNGDDLDTYLKKYNATAPDGTKLKGKPYKFNLMFQTQIGPSGKSTGFLRPETAQGMFVNFNRLYKYNSEKMPFAAAQIGLAFRNEIAPRGGLLRVREFTLAEIEHFCNPDDKSHPRFQEVADVKMSLLSRDLQDGQHGPAVMTVGEAVEKKIIGNQTLAYFMARTQLFLVGAGLPFTSLRFRQHMADEMAHYASDCWDAEIKNASGWVECVGHADRSAYDLTMHSQATGQDLRAQEVFSEPRQEEVVEIDLDQGKIGRTLKQLAKPVKEYFERLKENKEAAQKFEADLKSGSASIHLPSGENVTITSDMIKGIKYVVKPVYTKKYIPHVIEPAFGLGRILYSLLENAFYLRPPSKADPTEVRGVLRLPPHIAPTKVSIFPFLPKPELLPIAQEIAKSLVTAGISCKTDFSGVAIGRKYARTDEIGIPFAVTIDYDSVKNNTVTIRERDSMNQILVNRQEVLSIVQALATGQMTWDEAYAKYPHFDRPDEEEEKAGDKKDAKKGGKQ